MLEVRIVVTFCLKFLCFEITKLGFVPLGKGQGEVWAPAESERGFGYDGHGTTDADRYL